MLNHRSCEVLVLYLKRPRVKIYRSDAHSSTAPNRLVEAYFLSWSVSMSSDAPYWRPPSRALSMVFQTYGLEARLWMISDCRTNTQNRISVGPGLKSCSPRVRTERPNRSIQVARGLQSLP